MDAVIKSWLVGWERYKSPRGFPQRTTGADNCTARNSIGVATQDRVKSPVIRRAFPQRFDKLTDNGRTEPIRITVETGDGVEHEVVMKVSSGPECSQEGLMNEMLGSLLAADLGLPVNEPFFVELDADFVQSVVRPDIRDRLGKSCTVAFASKAAGEQWRRWMPSDRLTATQLEMAISVLAFDSFIANGDRGPRNSNLLVKDTDWRLIDHEGAFGFRMRLFPKCEPWKMGNLEMVRRYGQDSEHIFTKQLSKRDDLDFGRLRDLWSGLSDARLAQYDATLPDEWEATRPNLADAILHLKQVRDNVEACLKELKRVLS